MGSITTPSDHRIHGIYLFWIPLGAGGSGFVRLNGRVYEWLTARRGRRAPKALYHTALEVRLPEGRYIVETMWPSPGGDGSLRGVTVEGAVFTRLLSFTRVFRYEVRCWRDGELPDADQAVGGARLVDDDPHTGRRLLSMCLYVPGHTWGRTVEREGEMWNSNSVIAWLLAMTGVDIAALSPPLGGRAPGWDAGVQVAGGGTRADQPPPSVG